MGGLTGLIGFDGGYVGLGSADAFNEPVAWFTADGVAWEPHVLSIREPDCPGTGTLPGELVADAEVDAGGSNGSTVVLVGEAMHHTSASCSLTATSRTATWRSTDGRTWARSEFDNPNRLSTIWSTPPGWQAVSQTSIFASPDGVSWHRAEDLPEVVFWGTTTGAGFAGGSLVWTSPSATQASRFLGSTDGQTWQPVAAAAACAPGDGVLIAAPGPTPPLDWVISNGATTCTSPDLVSWRNMPFPHADPTSRIAAFARSGNALVASTTRDCQGCNPAWHQYATFDGATWREIAASVPAQFLATGPLGVVALGYESWDPRSGPVGELAVWRLDP
jgi:hypothetical protein